MSYEGPLGEQVSLSSAAGWTSAYRAVKGENDPLAHFFGKEKINDILEQSGCIGIRIYYGIENGQPILVLVGVDGDGNDLASGVIVENGGKCPPNCSTENDLNS